MDFLRPASGEEALAAEAAHLTSVPTAGGTDMLVETDFDHRRPEFPPAFGRLADPRERDHLVPTILDTPAIPVDVLELADPHAPYGPRGAGEAPTLSSTPEVRAAVRDATGREPTGTPVRPEHLTGTV